MISSNGLIQCNRQTEPLEQTIKRNQGSVSKNNHSRLTSMALTDLNNEQLMLRYAKGDVQAFELLYSKHKQGLFRYCYRQFSNRAIAEECYQEIWMKVINSRKNYQPKSLFTTFLYRIAKNHMIDVFRKEKKQQSNCEYHDENQYLAEQKNSATDNSQKNEAIIALRKQIGLLPFDQKNTLLLKIDAGLSLEEIAHISDCNKETVKSRLRYATGRLKKRLDDTVKVDSL